MILWTLTAVALLGVGVVTTVLAPPNEIIAARVAALNQGELVQVADRSPASAAPQFSALAIDDHGQQAIDFTLPCDSKEATFNTNVVQVRITGHLCEPAHQAKQKQPKQKREIASIESSEIRNMTNGFSATVFYPKADSFTTDYMTLAPGRNEVKITHMLKVGGRVEQNFVIQR